MAGFLTVFSDESAGSFRLLCCFLYIKLFRTLLKLSGLGNTTVVVAAIDAANAFRVCHIGNLFTILLNDVLKQYLFINIFRLNRQYGGCAQTWRRLWLR